MDASRVTAICVEMMANATNAWTRLPDAAGSGVEQRESSKLVQLKDFMQEFT